MNPTVSKGGRSFKGAFLYYMHDKGASTRDRVAWTHTVNMMTSDVDKAWKVMAYTAKNADRLKEASGQAVTGRKTEKPVLAYSLSWHPEQTPEPDHMRDTALRSLKVLGLEDHEAVLIAHSDTPHRHVHVVVNRVHPITGKVASDSFIHRKLSDFALEYGTEHGLSYSPQRAENKRLREQGQSSRYKDSRIAEAWAVSVDGNTFIAALRARGLTLAQGSSCLVVVDEYGKAHNPTRHLENVRAKDLRARLAGVDLSTLPNATELAGQNTAKHEAAKKEKTAQRHPPSKDPAPEKQRPAEPPQPTERDRDSDQPKPEDDRAERAAVELNQVQDRHIEERAAVSSHYHDLIERRKADISQYYRLDERAREIEELRARAKNPSLWRRLFGLARRDRADLAIAVKEMSDVQQRFSESIQPLETQRAAAMTMLSKRHAREWEAAVEHSSEKTRASTYTHSRHVHEKGQRNGPTYEHER